MIKRENVFNWTLINEMKCFGKLTKNINKQQPNILENDWNIQYLKDNSYLNIHTLQMKNHLQNSKLSSKYI